MLLRAVLSAQADRVSAALGTRSGVEMRAGRRAAERIGAQIVLGGDQIQAKRGEFLRNFWPRSGLRFLSASGSNTIACACDLLWSEAMKSMIAGACVVLYAISR